MRFFIDRVPAEDVEAFGTSDLYEDNCKFYYNAVEFGSNAGGIEDFVIMDTCNRSIPLSVTSIDSLIASLLHIQSAIQALNSVEELHECLQDPNCIHTFE